ncbi:MAG: hypothetical protein Q8R15_04735 [Candidatus Micrarchaeota archaeon]|nr:hypothetical protein [Candidatus Micrarchaeota archaeon]
MSQYSVHKLLAPETAHKLELRKNGKAIAQISSLGWAVTWISGRQDKEFVKEHGHTPAMELVLHLAKLVKPNEGRLWFWSVKPQGRRLIEGMQKRGIGTVEKDEGRHITFLTSAKPKLLLSESRE